MSYLARLFARATARSIYPEKVYCIAKTLCAVIAPLLAVMPVRADYLTQTYGAATTTNAFAYLKKENAGQSNSTSYVPVNSDWTGAVFQGYLNVPNTTYDTTLSGVSLEDTIYVFQTYIQSEVNTSLSLFFNGDDGHTMYVDDTLVAGGGFGVQFNPIVNMLAGVPIKLEMAFYNGLGAGTIQLARNDNLQSISTISGIKIDAIGNFATVPEAGTLALLGFALVPVGIGLACRRK